MKNTYDKILVTDMYIKGKKYRISACVNDMQLIDVRCISSENDYNVGDIFIGRVQNVVKDLNSAFVNITPDTVCYFKIPDSGIRYIKRNSERKLSQGDEILVQVDKDAVKTKAACVKADIELAGRYVVVRADNKTVGVSKKLNQTQTDRLKNLITDNKYSILYRTNAAEARDEDILTEYNRLSLELDDILSNASTRTCFTCMHRSELEYISFIKNTPEAQLQEIVTDNEQYFENIRKYLEDNNISNKVKLRKYEDETYPLCKLYNIERQLEKAIDKKVWLPGGGYLVIEPTEALTVIDVNTGSSVSKKDKEEHFLKTNIEAAEKAASEIRLRNISGIIIIDFIDLKNEDSIKMLMNILKASFYGDSAQPCVVDMTKLGLVEITRKKTYKSLKEQLT